MATLHIDTDRCKSCGYCVISCPQEALAISDSLNENGYNYVECDESKCVKCGICYTVCPDVVFELTED